MKYITIMIFNIMCMTILSVSPIASMLQQVAIIKYSDVKVYNNTSSLTVTEMLPLGSYIIYTAQNNQLEFLRISFPCNGWILATTVHLVSDQLVSDLPLWLKTPQLYSAGKGIMGSQVLSKGWVDQWPIGIYICV